MAQTPVKDPHPSRSVSENFNPNHLSSSPLQKSVKSKKSVQKSINPIIVTPRNKKIQERKFVVAKKKKSKPVAEEVASAFTCKCKDKTGDDAKKCPCIAYQTLRASQEDFFRKVGCTESDRRFDQLRNCVEEGEKKNQLIENGDGSEDKHIQGNGSSPNEAINQYCDGNRYWLIGESGNRYWSTGSGNSETKRRRDEFLEEVMDSVPEPGSGRVLHLVKAFEKLLTIPKANEGEEVEESKKGMKFAIPLPGLQIQPKVQETEVSPSSTQCSSAPLFTSANFGMDTQVSSSLDSNRESFSFTSRTSDITRRRRNSSESSGTFGGSKWKKKQLKVTSQQPFRLRTEQRGKCKEEEFQKKVKEMFVEEEKLRIPIAQGLPWTTDEPECLVKPPVKESTRPVDLVLHSDVRAVERSEFDHHVSEKLTLIEQYKLERERQQKLAEEEEIKRLRKELVPKAQPMPYFDRPFMPQRSVKHPTIPKEPKFHIPQHKKIKCMSWNDINISNSHNIEIEVDWDRMD